MEQPYQPIDQDDLDTKAPAGRVFEGVGFGPELSLDALDFSDCTFTRCLFEPRVVREANFSGAKFKDCTFDPARFASSTFSDARMENCSFFVADKKDGCTFAFCEMQTLELVRCNFASCSFDRADLYNLNAKDCSFRGAKFAGSGFQRSISRKVVLVAAKFDSCNLSFADMSGLHLKGCEFPDCKFSETLLFDCDCTDAVFTNAILDRAEWDRAILKGADLRGATISGLNLAVLKDYQSLSISESQQDTLLSALGIKVWPR
jgi:fluoroquinolone resistance protein